ncbi:MAG TPA: VWA domain-containing protein, partial [Acidobacteriaceae bacterium]|nr:VWA domain-containing protein [Acidobacteriaceae bacterium]
MKISGLTVCVLASLVYISGPLHAQPGTATPAQPAAAPASPQPAQAVPPTMRVYVNRVVLDVVVKDAKGNPVTGLTKDDFRVTDAKEPQTLTNFDTSAAHLVNPALTINSTADLDRLAPDAPVNIILLDEFNTLFEDEAFARYSLKKYLEKQPDKLTTPTMLLAVDIDQFTVLNDYTEDKQAILKALDHHLAAYPWRATGRSWAPERLATAFGTLERVAEATIGHPGHKNMIWIGRGFPSVNFHNGSVDSEQRVNNLVQRCVNMLRDARITLYAVDPAGLMVNPAAKYGNWAASLDPFGGNYDFARLAEATGGKSLYGRNDVDAEIGNSARDGVNFYTLTYRPTTGAMDPQKFRKIEVTVNRPGVTATTRVGYYVAMGPGRVNPTKPSRQLAFDLNSAATSTMAYDAVPLTVTQDPADHDSFMLHIEAKGLVWTYATDTEPRHANFVFIATTFDKKGKVLKEVGKVAKIDAPADAPARGRIEHPV